MNSLARPISGFEGYWITPNGKVYSQHKKGYIRTSFARGYEIAHLWRGNKQYSRPVHRLVADSFLERKAVDVEVNHIDGNKANNRAENLEWCTRSHNILHSYGIGRKRRRGELCGMAKLNTEQVRSIKSQRGKHTYAEIASTFGVSYSTVAHIMRGSRWQHLNI